MTMERQVINMSEGGAIAAVRRVGRTARAARAAKTGFRNILRGLRGG